ncbi:MAG TPA: FAD-dependent oxidoreductase [Hansschlegelia sp.]
MNAAAGPFRDGRRDDAPTVAIVGGGFTGAAVAHQLARRAPGAFRIVVIEPRERLGAGVAYSTPNPAHRINVPASRMTLIQSDPCHFDRWLKADGALSDDPEALLPDRRAFPSRSVFGRYVAETIEPYLLSGQIEHLCARARAIGGDPAAGYDIALSDGGALRADYVVLAASHPAPSLLPAFRPIADDPRLVQDTQPRGSLDGVATDARVLIVGTGLTMADIVASLDARGHRGPIVAVSRRGLLSRGHAETPGDEYGVFSDPPSRTAIAILRRIRRTVAAARAEGRPWQHVLDAVRAQGHAIWANLPEGERRKIVRRLRPFWDVHRFRVAPQVEAILRRRREEGSLEIVVGEPVSSAASAGGISVTLRRRGGATEVRTFDAVTLATGPGHRSLVHDDPLISGLAKAGVIGLDTVGLGLAVDPQNRAIGADGSASPTFWIAGPLARGSVGELMGLPEVARHAEAVAGDIVKTAAFGWNHAAA